MKEKDKEFIRDWFNSDLDIEIRAGKEKNILIAESNAYYHNGKRYKGDKRGLDAVAEFDDNDFKRIRDLLGIEYGYKELIETLEAIEERGLEIEVL